MAAVIAVTAFGSPPAGHPDAARASIRANGATRDGAAPVVRLVVAAAQTMRAPRSVRQATFAYGGDAAQRLDAYWPAGPVGVGSAEPADAASAAGAAALPGILIFHGGYWLGGDKSTWRPIARRLAARGYVVFAANYRLSPQAPWPAQLDDAAAALGYIQAHARRFRLDPARLVVAGSSAGGQVATMLGATGGRRIRGVVALSPVNAPYLAYVDGGGAEATALQRRLRRAVTKLVRCEPAGTATAACLFRLAHATPQVTAAAVPMLFVHSRGDFVPATQSATVRDALALAGVSAELKVVPGAAHGGGLLRARPVWTMVADWIDAVTSP